MACHGAHVWGAVSSAALRTRSLNHRQHSWMVLMWPPILCFFIHFSQGLCMVSLLQLILKKSITLVGFFLFSVFSEKEKSLCTLSIGSSMQMAAVRFPAHLTWDLETQWPIGYCWSSTCFLCPEDTVLTVFDFFFLWCIRCISCLCRIWGQVKCLFTLFNYNHPRENIWRFLVECSWENLALLAFRLKNIYIYVIYILPINIITFNINRNIIRI